MQDGQITRRGFVGGAAAAAAAAFTIVPRAVLGGPGNVAPSEQITLAAVGIGDQGTRDLKTFLGHPEIRAVAVCDVEAANRDKAKALVNAANKACDCVEHRDFREMLASLKDLDAVLCVVPDHNHAVVAVTAMKAGKHVYCQKPMAHNIREARVMAQVSREKKVATQLGTANQAGDGWRILREWIEAGCIGQVRQVHLWSNRPFWPQGMMDRPAETPPVPAGLDWDLWLGPAPQRPYHPAYLPLIFRGWLDFGTGALGDMGCYAFDALFRILDLGSPISVEGSGSGLARKMWDRPTLSPEAYPQASTITWRFAAGPAGPDPMTITWYDGGLRPLRPAGMDDSESLRDEGMIWIGQKGAMLTGFLGDKPRLLPQSRMDAFAPPARRIAGSIGHHAEWIRACRGGQPGGANFEFSARVTEALLLGNLALRFPGQALRWDSQKAQVPNLPAANALVGRQYRQGWTL